MRTHFVSRWLALACLLLPAPATAQTGTLEVRVMLPSGAPVALAGATVRSLPDSATVRTESTDAAGLARFASLPAGTYHLTVERIGYETVTQTVVAGAGGVTRVAVITRERVIGLPGVAVEAQRRRARFEESAGTTVAELTQHDMKLLPGLAEADVLRAVEILPGVVSTSDFSSTFNVRGGSADQNLIRLDGIPIFNPFHLGGMFSVFNADMVGRAELMAGGFPAQHGGRVSSVLSIESNAGAGGTDVDAGVSLLATRVALGLPLPDGALDFLGLRSARVRGSIRRSYFDKLLKPFFDFPYHLTDAQLFGEAWTRGGSRLTVTAYTGRDVLDLAGVDSFPLQVRWDWGNALAGATWTRPLGSGGSLVVRGGHSRFATAIAFPEFGDTELRSRIEQSLLRADAELMGRGVTAGLGVAADRLVYDNLAESAGTVFRDEDGRGWLLGSHAQIALDPGRWLIEAGLRLDVWLPADWSATAVVQPRIAVKHFVSRDMALKLAVGRYAQFMHSLRDEELPLGIDVWVLSGPRAPIVVSDQLQLGLEGFSGAWYGALEAYVRRFDGVATNNFAEDPDDPRDDLLAGTGRSWGADLQLRRDAGRVRPMLTVSWLKAWREFPDPSSGIEPTPIVRYAPVFDRRIDADVVVQAMLPREWELGIRWNLGTGLPYTRPLGGYVDSQYSPQDGAWRPPDPGDVPIGIVLGTRNGERYPIYHRLDAGVRRTFTKSWGTITPHLDVLNVYNRRNVLFYFYEYDNVPATRAGLSMFPLLPTAGVEIGF